ncbi:HEAT repeat domain-containing protein [Calderihabitans maritimus]|uniref:PBS lyase HEAT domain protein repeat-containing protein n=1 Tax=Calderihabitans maritimus TaxID=1246530 RepID=A0A1Z5HUE0_9FIRM|nr:HEAT repeat domain-containing protein [Calderihabitans maritimus]GAW93132.1 PBS lyase HEAT domain protein repeat-containing protein [Calderihabitans maritimus]
MERQDLLERLQQSNLSPSELIELLREAAQYPDEEVCRAVFSFVRHPDYLVRTRAFITLNQIAHPGIIPDLLEYLREEKDEEFRLRCLEVFHSLGDPAAVKPLTGFIHDQDPIFIRGLVWTIGSIGGEEAVRFLLEYGSSPAGRLVKREIVGEAIGMALEKVPQGQKLLQELAAQNMRIARYLDWLPIRGREKARFSVYPAPDYFRQCAKARGLDYREYKKLL